jgi:uncharacterized membrane protein (UPF0127 family)
MIRRPCILAPLFFLSLLGCQKDTTPLSNLPTTRMTIGQNTYTLEIAAREAERNKGLMQRDSMPANHGMIFVFTDEDKRQFWMHHTRIPLEILYLNAAGRIVSIHRMEPYVEEGTPSKGPAKFAIELNAGEVEKAGVKAGQLLALPEAIKNMQAEP